MCVYVVIDLLIYEFERWVTGVCSPNVVSLHTMWSGKSLQLVCILIYCVCLPSK